MKKIYFKLSFIAIGIGLFYACKNDLEIIPIEQQTIEYMFDTQDSAGVNANKFLYSTYTRLPRLHDRVGGDYLDAATDDAVSSNTTNTSVQQLAMGAYSATGYPDNQWSNFYTGIRQTNLFINNIDKVPLKGKLANGTSFNRVWKAEAKFLRALFYFELLKRYGAVPILGDQVYQLGDNIALPRNSFEECIDYIVNQCDSITDSLRVDLSDHGTVENPKKGAAMALKARVLLYAASPLYNGGNIESGNASTGYAAFSADRWKRAADAARDLINENSYELLPNFKDVFLVQANLERIFATQGGNNESLENTNGPIGYTGSLNNGRTSPTQELANAFGMRNGLALEDPLSGYDPQDPYVDRDPRFYATIFHNGAPWLNRAVETVEGGADKPGGIKQQTRTGYYLRKFLGNYENLAKYENVSHDHVLFRYAEVLLNFAEAQNEYLAQPDHSVYEAVELIRKRAGLDPYQLPTGLGKEEMRLVIQNERRKELAFEEHRFWDVRRWKLAEVEFNKQLHGDLVYKEGSGTLTHQDAPVLKMVFTAPRMYFAPIPYSEVVKNRNMTQNPGW